MFFLRAFACCLLAAVLPGALQADELKTGEIAPNWILMDDNGEAASLYQEAEQGRTTVMVFCASWCERCGRLLSQLHKISREQNTSQAAFYVMNVWESGDPVAFVEQHAPSFPLVLRADQVAKRFAVGITPGVVAVGPDKRVLYQRTPGAKTSEVINELQKLLYKQTPESKAQPQPTPP